MIRNVEEYLQLLEKELAGSDPATIQEALSDSEEYLRMALDGAMDADPNLPETEALASIIEKYGSPGEVASAYREGEKPKPGLWEQSHSDVYFSPQESLETTEHRTVPLVIVGYLLLIAAFIGYLVIVITGLVDSFPEGIVGLLAIAGLGLLFVKVLKERLSNKEDEHYSRNVKK
jgi:uncharacterized membrane protein